MLAKIVIKTLPRNAVVHDSNYDYITAHLGKELPVEQISFTDESAELFSVTVRTGPDTVCVVFVYEEDVDYKLYIGGTQIWPKQ